jgi:hypothetical protein
MAIDDTTARVAAFFDSYVRAFERYDAAGIADLFAYPAHVTGDADPVTPTTVPDRAGWEARLTELLGAYRALSVTTASILHSSITELSPRLAVVAVEWSLQDASGGPIYTFDATYTLADVDGQLRIAAIAHNETPRLRAAIGRLRGGG